MKVATRTTISMLLVAGVPLAVAGLSAIRLSEGALRDRAAELHENVARSLAEKVVDALSSRVQSIRDIGSGVDFGALGEDARTGALRLAFRQLEGASIVALFDADLGQAAQPVYLDTPSADPSLENRPITTREDLGAFARSLPLEAAREVGAGIGRPYVGKDGLSRITVAAKGHGDYVLAVELSLESLRRIVSDHRVGVSGRAFVVNELGEVILDGDPDAVAKSEDRSAWPAVAAALAGESPPQRFEDPLLGDSLGTIHRIQAFDWTVVVAEPAREALAASRALTMQTTLWLLVAVIAAGLLGLLSARSIVNPIRRLHTGASSLREGNLSHRIEADQSADEIADLSETFNAMAEEIQRWHDELEARVEEKTRELKEAQEMLLRSQKLAAVGELGAGVAHEINNPLAGILGMVQILRRRMEDEKTRASLSKVEDQAKRIREIVENLRRLAVDERDVGLVPTSLAPALDAALSMVENQLESESIRVVREYGSTERQVMGNRTQLTELFLHLISNARKAMQEGGTLTLGIETRQQGVVTIQVRDTGVGIAPELHSRIFEPFFTDKKDWDAKGMGLSLANKIVEWHNGWITVESAPGKGAAFKVHIPELAQRSLA